MTSIPNPFGGAAELREQRTASVAEPEARPTSFGRVHVIRVPDSAAASAGANEALYRIFQAALAGVGLIVGLPLILAAAALIRLDSPGPVLFRHRRPARSI